jgi:O-antigen/teichoic acid export membrane protein
MMKLLKRAIKYIYSKETKSVIQTLGLKTTSSAFNMLATFALAAFLNTDTYGTYEYAYSWMVLLSLFAKGGLAPLTVRETAKYNQEDSKDLLRGLIRWSHRSVIIASVVVGTIFTVTQFWWSNMLLPDEGILIWLISVPLLPGLTLLAVTTGTIRGLGRVVWAIVPKSLISASFLFGIFALKFIGVLNDKTSLLIRALSTISALLIAVYIISQVLPLRNKNERRTKPKQWFVDSLPMMITNSSRELNQRIPLIIAGTLIGPASTGILAVCLKVSKPINYMLSSVNNVMAPKASVLKNDKQKVRFEKSLKRILRLAFLASLITTTCVFLGGKSVLSILGKDYVGGYFPLITLCVFYTASIGIGPVDMVLNMTGYEKKAAIIVLVSQALNSGLCVVLIMQWGLIGAALSLGVSLTTWNITGNMIIRRQINVDTSILVRKF